jgi:hypothetical protein
MASGVHNDGRLISIRVVVQGDDDTYFLFVFTIERSDDGEQAMLKLHHFLVSEVWPHPSVHSHGLVNRLFWKDVIEMATLSTVSLTMLARYWKGMNTNRSHQFCQPNLEAHVQAREVLVATRTPSEDLNAMFHHPPALRASGSFIEQFPALSVIQQPCRAILIGQEVNKKGVVWLICATLALCFVVGVVVGLVSQHVDYGAGCGGVLFAMVGAVEGLIFWAFS